MSAMNQQGRATAIDAFLARAGWSKAVRQPIPGDASFRHYIRLVSGDKRALLMDAPPPENVAPFIAIGNLLRDMNLAAPAILAQDEANGLLLLEDFGDDTYTSLLARGEAETPLYELAVDVQIALAHRFNPATASAVPPYDDERLLNEAALLVDWYWPAVHGKKVEPSIRAEYLALWQSLFGAARNIPSTLVLRDYHVNNLMRRDGKTGLAACGLLDFQDAVQGPQSYDLVSLLEDSRRDVPADLSARMMARYLAGFPALDRDAFATSFNILAAQRHAKVIGIFTRLCHRDGKPHYLVHIPRLWRLLDNNFKHPALARMAAWFDTHFPQERRLVPAVKPAA